MNLRPKTIAGKKRHLCGLTLIEVLVSTAVGVFIGGSIITTGTTLSTTMAAIGNYCDLNSSSRNTLDVMSADLRNTAIVTSVDSKQVTVSNVLTGDLITYAWNGRDSFTRSFNGASKVMLKNCDYLSFANFSRNPTNGFQFVPATSAATTKLLSVSWRCSRKIMGAKINTESIQTAQICIRN